MRNHAWSGDDRRNNCIRVEERYRSLVELSPDALFVQTDGQIVFINSAGFETV
jgi:hypothetical protein